MKPILFNTEMVQAILEGRKTVTRRPVKTQPNGEMHRLHADSCFPGCFAEAGSGRVYRPPYMAGDALYVRETWARLDVSPGGNFRPNGVYYYKAGPIMPPEGALKKWRPSIHMPRDAARIFLRVTMVRAERLRDMVLGDVLMEGIKEAPDYDETWIRWHNTWNKTIPAADRDVYGREANPWVWVIAFERISKEEAGLCQT